jgi:hypothetical protein
MAESRGTVVMVDDDIIPLLFLAHELHNRGINLIPAKSAKEARATIARLKLQLDELIISCRVSGVCALTKELVQHRVTLEVIGIVSGYHQCSSCRPLLTYCFQDAELRDIRWMHRMVSLIQSRLAKKPSPAKFTILRRRKR